MRPVVLSIAGSDSSGGAGVQADVTAIVGLGAHAATVVTAVTAQNTARVTAVHPVPDAVVEQQLAAVLDDLPVAAAKTGMFATPGQVAAVARALAGRAIPLVVDPVLVATSGDRLAAPDVAAAIADDLLPLASLLTPNRPELEALAGRPCPDLAEMVEAACLMLDAGARAVLAKGGHVPGSAVDALVTAEHVWELQAPVVTGPPVHGTGCTLAAMIATRLAYGEAMLDAVRNAKAWLTSAIEAATSIGHGARVLGAPTRRVPIAVRERGAPIRKRS